MRRLRLRRPSLETAITAAVVIGLGVFILLQLQPGLLIAKTTPAGGDMGAHVWAPAYLRDHLLPHGRITGWTPDWYAGFPALHYYFPLPSLVIVALDTLLPYGVAFKLVAVAGLVFLPAAAATLGRQLRLPFPTPALLACMTVPFVFDRFHTIWGGNAAATLAGEFAFSIGLAGALFFLAALARALETGKGRALAAVLLAVTALCHLLPAALAVVGALVLIAVRRPDKARWSIVAMVGIVGAGLAAFWFVPFILRLPYSNDMGWERTFNYLDNLFPFLRHDDAAPVAATSHLKIVFPLAALGVVLGLVRKRRGVVVLTAIALLMAVGFRFVPAGPIWNARLLPFWYLFCYFLAGVAIAEVSLLVRDLFTEPEVETRSNVAPVIAAASAFLSVIVLAGVPLGVFSTGRIDLPGPAAIPFPKLRADSTNFVPSWARWNFSGYERKPDYPEFREAVNTMARVGRTEGCGRAMWEYEPELNRYGTPMALMLLPYFTNGCIGSMEGLFFESSATVPYHFLNQSELSKTPSRAMRDLPYRDLDVDQGVEHLQLLGVRYYMALTPETQSQALANPDLRLIASTSPHAVTYGSETKQRFWQVFEVADSELVKPLAYEPVVVEKGVQSKHGWLDAAVDWYQQSTRWDIPFADAGPKSWPRVPRPTAALPAVPAAEALVTNIRTGDDRISFDVDRPGTPVLVKASYFPNWKASGAEGPWRVSPNLMVVVPTSKHVSLHYGWTGIDLGAWAITGLAALAILLLLRRPALALPEPRPVFRRRQPPPDGPLEGDDDVTDEVDAPRPVPALSGSGAGEGQGVEQ
jgi:hypothetical protein